MSRDLTAEVDEGAAPPPCTCTRCQLRLLCSARFDSQSLLCIVLAGDARLLEKLRREELIPLGSRIRTRLASEAATREELIACLEHLLTAAGNAGLMSRELRQTLCDHAAGNYRVLVSMAAELLMTAAHREITTLDEKLYLQVFSVPPSAAPLGGPQEPDNHRRAQPMPNTSEPTHDVTDRPRLIVDLPELSDEAAWQLSEFLQAFAERIDAHYSAQISREHRAQERERGQLYRERVLAEAQQPLPFPDLPF